MIEALRNDDLAKLALYDDNAPIGLKEILKGMDLKLKSKASPLYTVKSTDGGYIDRIAKGLTSMGFGEDESIQAAADTLQDGKTTSVLEGGHEGSIVCTRQNTVRCFIRDEHLPLNGDGRKESGRSEEVNYMCVSDSFWKQMRRAFAADWGHGRYSDRADC